MFPLISKISSHLEVDVFQSPEGNTVDALWESKVVLLLKGLVVDLTADDGSVNGLLMLETINVICGMGVDLLKGSGEFIIKTLDERNDAAWDLEGLSLSWRRGLLVILPIFCVLDNDVLLVVLEDVEESVDFTFGPNLVRIPSNISIHSKLTISIGRRS